MLLQPPHHPLCANEVGYGPQGRNHGSKTSPREGGRLVQGHKASLVPRFSCQAHARPPPPPPRHTACVARLVPPGYPALTWCQSPPGPVPGWGFNRTGIQHLYWGGGAAVALKAQSGCWLPPASLPPTSLPSQASLWPDTSKQAFGHFMCPFIALNGEGLPAPALKGQRQEGCRPSGKCVCVGVRVGG